MIFLGLNTHSTKRNICLIELPQHPWINRLKFWFGKHSRPSYYWFAYTYWAVEEARCLAQKPRCILTFAVPFIVAVFLRRFPDYLIDFISILAPRNSLVWKLNDIRKSVESASKIRFPSSRIGAVITFPVPSTVDGPAFENTGVLRERPALSWSVLPGDLKDAFVTVLPL